MRKLKIYQKIFTGSILLLFSLFIGSCTKPSSSLTAPHITNASSGILSINNDSVPYPYYLHIPPEFDKHEYKYPLLVFLHGAGELSDSLDPVALRNGPLSALYNTKTGEIDTSQLSSLSRYLKSSFILVPQTSSLISWKKPIKELIEEIQKKYPIDNKRIYLTGLSLGGGAAWNHAELNPELYAAIVPVCGYASFPGKEALKDTALWVFHAFDDKLVPLEYTTTPILQTILGTDDLLEDYPHAGDDKTIAAKTDLEISFYDGGSEKWLSLKENKPGKINFTLYRTGGHNAWTRAYTDQKMWKWLYSQSK